MILEESSLLLSSILFIEDEKQKGMHNSLIMNISVKERKLALGTGLGLHILKVRSPSLRLFLFCQSKFLRIFLHSVPINQSINQ